MYNNINIMVLEIMMGNALLTTPLLYTHTHTHDSELWVWCHGVQNCLIVGLGFCHLCG